MPLNKLFYIFIILVLFVSCKSKEEERVQNNQDAKKSEKTDLRKSMNGYWIMISQSFTKGRKLEKFPVGGTVGIIFNEKDEWYSVTRKFRKPEDTITKGSFYLEGDRIVMEVLESKDVMSYKKLVGKVELNGRFLQLEGEMTYTGDKLPEYTHAILGRSARTLEEIFEEDD